MEICIHCDSLADGVDGKCQFHSADDVDEGLLDSIIAQHRALAEPVQTAGARVDLLGSVPLKTYRVSWEKGRKVGAPGSFYGGSVTVEAESPEAARLKAYETHEHLAGVRVDGKGLGKCPMCGEYGRPGKMLNAGQWVACHLVLKARCPDYSNLHDSWPAFVAAYLHTNGDAERVKSARYTWGLEQVHFLDGEVIPYGTGIRGLPKKGPSLEMHHLWQELQPTTLRYVRERLSFLQVQWPGPENYEKDSALPKIEGLRLYGGEYQCLISPDGWVSLSGSGIEGLRKLIDSTIATLELRDRE